MLYKICKYLLFPFIYILYRPKVIHKTNMPFQGKCILVCNHISLIDPLVIGCSLPRQINYMAKAELFKNKIFRALLLRIGTFPVKRGASDISAIKNALLVLKNENVLGIFPEGTRSINCELQDFESGVAFIAYKSEAPVLPVLIQSQYRIFHRTVITVGSLITFDDIIRGNDRSGAIQKIANGISEAMRNLQVS